MAGRRKRKDDEVAVLAAALAEEALVVWKVMSWTKNGAPPVFGAPTKCPECGAFGLVIKVDSREGRARNRCTECQREFVLTERAIDAVTAGKMPIPPGMVLPGHEARARRQAAAEEARLADEARLPSFDDVELVDLTPRPPTPTYQPAEASELPPPQLPPERTAPGLYRPAAATPDPYAPAPYPEHAPPPAPPHEPYPAQAYPPAARAPEPYPPQGHPPQGHPPPSYPPPGYPPQPSGHPADPYPPRSYPPEPPPHERAPAPPAPYVDPARPVAYPAGSPPPEAYPPEPSVRPPGEPLRPAAGYPTLRPLPASPRYPDFDPDAPAQEILPPRDAPPPVSEYPPRTQYPTAGGPPAPVEYPAAPTPTTDPYPASSDPRLPAAGYPSPPATDPRVPAAGYPTPPTAPAEPRPPAAGYPSPPGGDPRVPAAGYPTPPTAEPRLPAAGYPTPPSAEPVPGRTPEVPTARDAEVVPPGSPAFDEPMPPRSPAFDEPMPARSATPAPTPPTPPATRPVGDDDTETPGRASRFPRRVPTERPAPTEDPFVTAADASAVAPPGAIARPGAAAHSGRHGTSRHHRRPTPPAEGPGIGDLPPSAADAFPPEPLAAEPPDAEPPAVDGAAEPPAAALPPRAEAPPETTAPTDTSAPTRREAPDPAPAGDGSPAFPLPAVVSPLDTNADAGTPRSAAEIVARSKAVQSGAPVPDRSDAPPPSVDLGPKPSSLFSAPRPPSRASAETPAPDAPSPERTNGDGVAEPEAPAPPTPAALDRPLRVLLVEDDPTDAAVVEALLGSAGPEVVLVTASSRERGQSVATDEQPDVVLLDLDLPDSHGLATITRWIFAGLPGRVIVMSGDYSPELVERGKEQGVAEFVHKRHLMQLLQLGEEGTTEFVRLLTEIATSDLVG